MSFLAYAISLLLTYVIFTNKKDKGQLVNPNNYDGISYDNAAATYNDFCELHAEWKKLLHHIQLRGYI